VAFTTIEPGEAFDKPIGRRRLTRDGVLDRDR
jgi:hypothetical protein